MLKQWLLQFCQALAGIGRVFACIQPATQPPGNTSPLLGRLAAVGMVAQSGIGTITLVLVLAIVGLALAWWGR